jgi:hypothetical protein
MSKYEIAEAPGKGVWITETKQPKPMIGACLDAGLPYVQAWSDQRGSCPDLAARIEDGQVMVQIAPGRDSASVFFLPLSEVVSILDAHRKANIQCG